jgi:hypothetical protein
MINEIGFSDAAVQAGYVGYVSPSRPEIEKLAAVIGKEKRVRIFELGLMPGSSIEDVHPENKFALVIDPGVLLPSVGGARGVTHPSQDLRSRTGSSSGQSWSQMMHQQVSGEHGRGLDQLNTHLAKWGHS